MSDQHYWRNVAIAALRELEAIVSDRVEPVNPEMSVADTLREIANTARLFPISETLYRVALTDMDLEALRLAADQLEPVERIKRDIEADVDRIAREQWGGARE